MQNTDMKSVSARIICVLLMLLLTVSTLPMNIIATSQVESSTGVMNAQSEAGTMGVSSTEASNEAEITKSSGPLIPWNLIGNISKSLRENITGLQPEDKVRVLIRVKEGYQSVLVDTLPEDAEVHFVYQLVPYVSATVKVEDIEWISELPYVISVLLDEKVYVAVDSLNTPANTTINDPYQDAFYLLNETNRDINSTALWNIGYTGEGVVIAILDTGIEESHPDLDDMDDDPTTNDPKVIGEVSFVPGESADVPDIHWHGTHVASIAAGTGAASQTYPENLSECARWWTVPPGTARGVAPGAYLLDVKVLSAAGWGYDSWILAGIEWAVNHGADIISMSLGGEMYSPAYREACQAAIEKGVVVVAAAGNSGPSRMTMAFPGGLPEIISVGASSETSPAGTPGVIDFSSRGPAMIWAQYGDEVHLLAKPDVVAPGYMVMAAFAWYDVYQDWTGYPFDGWFYIVAGGTSMATPHVSGAAALLLQAFPGATPEAIKAALTESAVDLGYPSMVQGRGLINVGAAYELLAAAPTTTYDQAEAYAMNVSNYIYEHSLVPQDFEDNLTLIVDEYTRFFDSYGRPNYWYLTSELSDRGMSFVTLSDMLMAAGPKWKSFGLFGRVESPHPYLPNMNETYTIRHPGALYIQVHFDNITLEAGYDYLYLYDKDWNLITYYTGHNLDVWTPPIQGDTVYIVLVSDWIIEEWGFRADMYRAYVSGFFIPFEPIKRVYCTGAGYNETYISDIGANYLDLRLAISLEGSGDNVTIWGRVNATSWRVILYQEGPLSYDGWLRIPSYEVYIRVESDNSTAASEREAEVTIYSYQTWPVTLGVLQFSGVDVVWIPNLIDVEGLSEILPPEALSAWVKSGGNLLFEGDDVPPPKTSYNVYTEPFNVTWSPNAEGRVYETTNIAVTNITEGVNSLAVGGAVASLIVESPAVTVVNDTYGHPIVAAGVDPDPLPTLWIPPTIGGRFVIVAPDTILNDDAIGWIPFLYGIDGDNLEFGLNIFYWLTGAQKGKGRVEYQLVHDLAISWLSYPSLVINGTALEFSAEIVNTGHYTENFTLYVYVWNCTGDLVFNGTRTYINFENGTSIVETWSFTPTLIRGLNDTVGLTINLQIVYEFEDEEPWLCERNNEISSEPHIYPVPFTGANPWIGWEYYPLDSPHPYEDNMAYRWMVKLGGGYLITDLYFDYVQLNYYDYLYIYNEDWDLIDSVNNYEGDWYVTFWSEPTETVYIVLETHSWDNWNNLGWGPGLGYGFSLYSVSYLFWWEHGIWATIKTERSGPSPVLTSATPSEVDGTTGPFVIMYPFDLNILSVSFYTSGPVVNGNLTITGNITELVSFWNVTTTEIIDNPLIWVGPETVIGPGLDVMPVMDMSRGTVVADLYMWTPQNVELGNYTGEIVFYNASGVIYTMPITLEVREPVGTILYGDVSMISLTIQYYTFWVMAAEAGYDIDPQWIMTYEALTMWMEAWQEWLDLKPWERGPPPDFEDTYLDLLASLDYDAYMAVEPYEYYGLGSWYYMVYLTSQMIYENGGSLLVLANYYPDAANELISIWYQTVFGYWYPYYYGMDISYYRHPVYDPVVSRADHEIGVESDHYIFEGKDKILWAYEAYHPYYGWYPTAAYLGLTDTDKTTVMAVGLDAYSEPPYWDDDYSNYAVIHEADCSDGALVSGSELIAFAGYSLFTTEILEYGDLNLWYSYPFQTYEDGCLASTWEAGDLGDNVKLLKQLLELLCNRPPTKEVTFDKDEYTAGEDITITLNVTDDLFSAEEIYVEASLYVMYFNKTLFELYPTKPWRWYEWDVVDSVNGTYAEMGTFTLTIPKSALNQTGTVNIRIYDGYGDEICQEHEVKIVNKPPVVTSVTPSEFLVTPGDKVSIQIEVTDDSSNPEDLEVFVWIKYVDYVDVEHKKIKCPILVKTSSLKQMATYEDGVFTVTFDTYPGPEGYWKWPTGRYIAVVIVMDEAGPISPYDLYGEYYYEEYYEMQYFIHYGIYPSMIEEAIRFYMQDSWYVDWEELQEFIDNFGTVDYLPIITSRLWRTWATSIIESTTFIIDYEPAIIRGEIQGLYDDNEAKRNSTVTFVVHAIDEDEGLGKTATFRVHLPDGTTETVPGEFAGRTSDGRGTWTASYDLTGKPKGSYYVEATVTDVLGTSTTTIIGVFHVVDIPSSMISINVPPGATAEDMQAALEMLKEIAEMIGNWTGFTSEVAGYSVGTITTSTIIAPPTIAGNVIELRVSGPDGTTGTSVIILQKGLLDTLGATIDDMVVLLDGEPIEPDEVKEYPTYYTVKVTYTHSEHLIAIHFTGNLDSDKDGVTDWKEYVIGADPLKSDTDGDLWNDNIDMWPTNPLLPNVPITILIAVTVAVAYYLLVIRRRVVII